MISTKEQRHSKRTPLSTPGTIIANGKSVPFCSKDVSVDGCCLAIKEGQSLQVGMSIKIDLPIMQITNKAIVRWLSSASGTMFAGVEFQNIFMSMESAV